MAMSRYFLLGLLVSWIARLAAALTSVTSSAVPSGRGPVGFDLTDPGIDIDKASASLEVRAVENVATENEVRRRPLVRKEALLAQSNMQDARGFPLLIALGFEPKRILDVGANVGDWTRSFMRIFPNATFLMLDGTDHIRDWWDLRHTAAPSRVDAEVAVLGDREGQVNWYENPTFSTGNSWHKEQSALFNHTEGTSRHMETLDGLLHRTNRDPNFDLVKLDVQGTELDILRGAPNLLSNAQVLLLEMPFAGAYNEGAASFAEYIAFLDQAGFAPFDTEQFHRVTSKGGINEDHGFLIQVDFIFVRKGSSYLEQAQKSIKLVGSDVVAKLEQMKGRQREFLLTRSVGSSQP